jgi:mannose/fructose-specific phosphotransferase system component IIA
MSTSPPPPHDPVDYAHRTRVNIIAGLSITVLLALFTWSMLWMAESERMQRCIASGRRDCEKLDIPPPEPRQGILVPAH